MTKTLAAIQTLERLVTTAPEISGTVLRYGSLYGPGTGFAPDGDIIALARARQLPIVGEGAGVWSFIHVDDAASAVLRALEGELPGVYNVVDDDPAEVSIWLPLLAQLIGAKPPRRIPVWLARFALGDAGVSMMTAIRGSSNVKAKHSLEWKPAFPTWQEGFRYAFS